jgi:hypothetical protein
MISLRNLPVLLVLAALTSCGGGDGTCAAVTPCGGTIAAGRYRISSYCVSSSAPLRSNSCPAGITVNFSNFTVKGTVTFNADNTYSTQGTAGGTVTETIPAECLRRGGVQITCAQLQQSLQVQAPDGRCSGNSACTCTFTIENQPTEAMGTYSTSGNILTVTPDGGEASSGSYCATPTEVSFSAMSMSSLGMMDMTAATSSTVLTKE